MEETKYSNRIVGDVRNYKWEVCFDVTLPDIFVGITQYKGETSERVLLSKAQWEALQEFVRANKACGNHR